MDHENSHASRQIFTVSQLTKEIKSLLEKNFSMIWISGEVSNLRMPSSGHSYFTLKDEKAQIPSVMFRGQLRQLRFELEDGINIIGLGRISVYEPRGSYQIILEYAEPKGAGALQLAFEQTKQKLAAEGLFDAERKKPLPFLPHTVCVITSPTGAAIQDIFNIILRRFSTICIKVLPVRVQGAAAPDEIVAALQLAKQKIVPDVIILARGGGSIEDLAAFNSESVARAIYESDIPIVSAIGHETDFTIADFVSDVRAPTPSAAAELVAPVKVELLSRCLELRQRCYKSISQIVSAYEGRLDRLLRGMVHPVKKVEAFQQRIDEMLGRLGRAKSGLIRDQHAKLNEIHFRLKNCAPSSHLQKIRSKVELLLFRLLKSNEKYNLSLHDHLGGLNAKLRTLNPKAVLERGYSITRCLPDLEVVMDASEVQSGQSLEILLAKGKIKAKSE